MKNLLLVVVLFLSLGSLFAQETTQQQEQQVTAVQSGDFDSAMKLYRQKHYNEAIAEFQKVVAADPKNAAAYYMMGYAHYVLDHHAEALAAFEKAFEANPAFDPRPYFRR